MSDVETHKDKIEQLKFFDDKTEPEWKDEWQDMPEYNNIKKPGPKITVTFKFRNNKDFEVFNELLKKHVYKTNKVFDGMQRKEEKWAWFPLDEKASNYEYVTE